MAHMTQEEYKKNVREVYRTTAILSVVTIVEVVGALMYDEVCPCLLAIRVLYLAFLLV